MNIKEDKTVGITWDIDLCKANATIKNNQIESVEISMLNNNNNSFKCTNEEYLRNLHKALGNLISYLDKERGMRSNIALETEKTLNSIFVNN